MLRIGLFALLAIAAFAQTDAPQAEKPPADVDQALRARVADLYKLWQSKQYRKAESLVSEDTRDYYYDGAKPDIRSFEVLDIEYSERFTHAKAMTKCVEPLVVAGFPPGEITVKMPTLWRLEDGNWYLYEDAKKMANPSGLNTKVEAAVKAGTDAAKNEVLTPETLKDLPKDPGYVLGKLRVDKPDVEIAPDSSAEVHIDNQAPGPMILELGYPLKGVECKLDRTNLDKGETATLTLKAGKEPSGGIYYLRVLPTEEAIAIRVKVKP